MEDTNSQATKNGMEDQTDARFTAQQRAPCLLLMRYAGV